MLINNIKIVVIRASNIKTSILILFKPVSQALPDIVTSSLNLCSSNNSLKLYS